MRDVLNFKNFLEGVNNTLITIMPKVTNAKRIGDFKPISLCNVIYKIVAKNLANWLKFILPKIISPQQSGFVPRHLIIDNILIAYEVLHFLSTRLKGKERFMSLKLDMRKAYDKIKFIFLKVVMLRLEFTQNGAHHMCCKPSRGIWQGNALSPYLFIMCAKTLSCLLLHANLTGFVSSFPMGGILWDLVVCFLQMITSSFVKSTQ